VMNILWDFDGTLFDTYPAYTRIMKDVLGEKAAEEEILSKLKVSFTHAFSQYNLGEEEIAYVRRMARSLKPQDLQPFPGVKDVLQRAGCNVIMTHKEREDVLLILEHHNMSSLFADLVAGDDGYPRKPHKASYEYLHGRNRIDLAIGDRELDILPAKELGIRTCLFQNSTPGADYYLSQYEDFDSVIPWNSLK
jgi:HAD superfamily hydrolase (TIGR01549 family)